ncbi:15955_t:CDS:2, partial [Gigaspora rosea]
NLNAPTQAVENKRLDGTKVAGIARYRQAKHASKDFLVGVALLNKDAKFEDSFAIGWSFEYSFSFNNMLICCLRDVFVSLNVLEANSRFLNLGSKIEAKYPLITGSSYWLAILSSISFLTSQTTK